MDLRQGCVMSPWLFNISMDGVMREMNGKVGEVGVRMYAEEVGVRQGCVMSPWLFNIFMDGCMKEMKCKVG